MAIPNLQLVLSLYEHWKRGEYDTGNDWAHPDIEWVIADGPDPGSWRGLDGMAEGFRTHFGVWRDMYAEVEEFRELDDDRVLVLEQRRARGRASGLDLKSMRAEGAVVFELRDAKVTRLVFYWDRSRAFADLGLQDS